MTTCRVAKDGIEVELEFIDQSGKNVTVELPLDQAEVIVVTLPRLLSRAVRQRAGNDEARYVFDLGEWVIEGAKERTCLIATLKTPNRFEVSLAIPLEACRSFGWTLQREASDAIEARKMAKQAAAAGRGKFNRMSRLLFREGARVIARAKNANPRRPVGKDTRRTTI